MRRGKAASRAAVLLQVIIVVCVFGHALFAVGTMRSCRHHLCGLLNGRLNRCGRCHLRSHGRRAPLTCCASVAAFGERLVQVLVVFSRR